MVPKFFYTGPSWANNSYPIDIHTTNLALQWDFDYVNGATLGIGNHGCYAQVKKYADDMPVVWIYCEPLLSIREATGMSMADFVVADNWQSVRETCNQYCLDLINSLSNPVFLIGAHCDITNFSHKKSHVTIGEKSWQKWMAQQTGLSVNDDSILVTPRDGGNYKLDLCWGAEIIHRFLHQNPTISPLPSLLDAVWDVYYFWQYLEEKGWFFEVHPNRRSNVAFAKFLKPAVETFLTESIQNKLKGN